MKFQKGNKGGGRPKAQHTIETEAAKKLLVSMFLAECEPIFKKLIADAKRGDPISRKDLLDRVFGKPKESHELSTKDDKPLPIQIIDFSTYKPKVVTD